jgi:hypothetical protein
MSLIQASVEDQRPETDDARLKVKSVRKCGEVLRCRCQPLRLKFDKMAMRSISQVITSRMIGVAEGRFHR